MKRPLVQVTYIDVFSMARLGGTLPSIHRRQCGHIFEQDGGIPKGFVFTALWPAMGCCHQCEGIEP